MVLQVAQFRFHRSLRKTVLRFRNAPEHEVRFDSAFADVITQCASTPRNGQNGTWILAEMVQAYTELNRLGVAHSVETWVQGQLVGGLYCVAIGRAVYGESMFSPCYGRLQDCVGSPGRFCRAHGIVQIDCQQTRVTWHPWVRGNATGVVSSPNGASAAAASPNWQFSPILGPR